ncbi:hypothetical protein F5B20DRAFT_551145 [Whalleya microplaca]|nr:hypothetical protein F5B20DRAFT_551145 [Whalleya microplaca]
MADLKKKSGAGITMEERTGPGVAWEAAATNGTDETQKEMMVQWAFIILLGVAAYGYCYHM